MVIRLIVSKIRQMLYNQYIKMSQYFPKSYDYFGGDIETELELSDYATKIDLNGVTEVNTCNLSIKIKVS